MSGDAPVRLTRRALVAGGAATGAALAMAGPSTGSALRHTWVGDRTLDFDDSAFATTGGGHTVPDITRGELTATFWALPYVTTPGAPISTIARFAITDGTPGAQPR